MARALVEDALKYVHAAELRGTSATPESLAGHLRQPLGSILGVLADTEARGLTQTAGACLTLTPTGRDVAVCVIRAHRLLERYFADELGMPLTALHAAADAREHSVTTDEASALDARLGYPTHDPHGDPIPSADGQLASVESVLLSQQPVGQPAVILRGEPSSFTLELPPYRRPNIGQILYTSLIDRTLFVLWRAIVMAAPAGGLIWLLSHISVGATSLTAWIAMALDPAGRALGLDGVILLAYVIAIPANEIVVPTILMAYAGSGMLIESVLDDNLDDPQGDRECEVDYAGDTDAAGNRVCGHVRRGPDRTMALDIS